MFFFIVPSCASNWTSYLSYHDATKDVCVNGKIYTLASGGLYYYCPGELKVHTFSKVTGLSDTNIKFFVYNSKLSCFLLVYADYNIDILGTNDSIVNIPEYKNSDLSDKTINAVTISGKYAYLSTNFGVVVIDMQKCEFANTYNMGMSIHSSIRHRDKILAAADNGIYVGNVLDNLQDKKNWNILGNFCPSQFVEYGDSLYTWADNGFYTFDADNGNVKKIYNKVLNFVNRDGELLVMGNNDEIITMNENDTFKTYRFANSYKWVCYDGTKFWASNGYKGLVKISINGDTLIPDTISSIIPNSPIRNYCYYLGYTKNNRLLVGGGSLNYVGLVYPGTVMAYNNGTWTNFSEDSISAKTGLDYQNITSVAQDPNDENHHFASAASAGLYEFRNGFFVHLYDADNSPLTSILPNNTDYRYYNRTAGLNYDSEGNLWMLNNQVDTVVRILKPNGVWKSIYIPELSGYPTFDKILFDSRGWAWITHRRTTAVHHAGILCINFNGTVDNTVDDTYKFHYSFTNQDNTTYTFSLVYDVAEDRDGYIWIGTDQGPFVLTDPTMIFTSSPVFMQIKVPRNDGTNYVDYLLTGVPITAIAIDGGNRKWFGTNGDGVYLISADGLAEIHHFTAENSPLLSNVIYSIAINNTSGEVMFGTDAGLIGYRSDATEPAEDLESKNLKVYPNPVRPGYEGSVTVTGWSENSDVKVTTVGGEVVYKGLSVGGTFTWNCRNKVGKRVATGIYYFIGSNDSGRKGAVAKVLIMK